LIPKQTDVIAWEIDREGRQAVVREDGRIESDDPDLRRFLQERLQEPVVVFRHGTVACGGPEPSDGLELRPGDSRYVVACIRSLAAGDPGIQIMGIVLSR
jgi:hypothetical protein